MNFLRHFVLNYVELSKGFNHLLKKGVPFIWDEVAKKSFDALRKSLISALLLHPPNYLIDFFLYLAITDSTIAMIIVQDDDDGDEHVIYYLSLNHFYVETQYAHVKKLASTTIHTVQLFWDYILLRKSTVISDCNPMTYILTRQLLGGSILNGLLICDLPSVTTSTAFDKLIHDETLFLINTLDPWYREIITSLENQKFRLKLSNFERRHI